MLTQPVKLNKGTKTAVGVGRINISPCYSYPVIFRFIPHERPRFRDVQSNRIWSFSSEKSYSPCRLMCRQVSTEPVSYSREEFLPTLFAVGLGDFLREIEVIPTDDGVFDQSSAVLSDFLLDLFPMEKFLIISKR